MNGSVPEPPGPRSVSPVSASPAPSVHPMPSVPDHALLCRIGGGGYGEVWLARSVLGTYRAVKVVYRSEFETGRPFEREFSGIEHFEPISRFSAWPLELCACAGC